MSDDPSTGGRERTEVEKLDPYETPTVHAFDLTTEAHTNLCCIQSEDLGRDEDLLELYNTALEACVELFEALAEERGMTRRQYQDAFMRTRGGPWERDHDATPD